MESFDASLRLGGDRGPPVHVEVDLSDERMVIRVGANRLADWELSDLRVFSLPDGFHINANGDEVVINFSDSTHFAAEVNRLRRSR